MSEIVYYKLAQSYWDSDGPCVVLDDADGQLMVLPSAFLRIGLVDNVDFVLRQLSFAFHNTDHCDLTDAQGRTLQHSERIVSGTYRLKRNGE